MVAYSGGLDSTVLLAAALATGNRAGFTVGAVHFHHGLNPAADDWAEHCRRECERLGVRCQIHRLVVPVKGDEGREGDRSHVGIEATARRLRYRILDGLDADRVLLGHHADDQAETVLLNLLRGAGILGLAGMPPVRGRYVRPLLGFTRMDLRHYAEVHGLTWCEDDSNRDTRFMRNFVRAEVLPVLAQRVPSSPRQLADTAQRMGDVQRLLDDLAQIDAGTTPLIFPFPVAPFVAVDAVRAANLLHSLLHANALQTPSAARLREFVRQLQSAGPDRHPELRLGPQTIRLRRRQLRLENVAETGEEL